MGDLNAKSTLWAAKTNNDNGDILDNIILENDCIIVNNKDPTHLNFNGKTSSILDYCIISTTIHDIFENFAVLNDEDMTSDHLPFLLKLKSNQNNLESIKNPYFNKSKTYNYKKANWLRFKSALPGFLDENIGNNVDKLEEFIRKSLINASDSAIPIYQNDEYKHKLPEHILDLIKARKLARKVSKEDPNCISAKRLYNKLTKIIREENKATKDKEWSCFIDKLGANPPSTKPFWNRINTVRGKKNKQPIPTLKVDNTTYESDEQKANLFSNILQTTFSLATDQQFNDKFKQDVENSINNFDFSTHNEHNKETFELKELNMVIKNLNKKSACGEDKLSNLMIQNTTQEFRKIILYLINETVKQSKLPQNWKSSLISMIPKKQNNSSNPKYYRPISLTSCLAKLAERLMLIKFKEFLDKNKIIIKQQSGFRQKRQTKDNIFFLTQKAIETLNRGKRMCTIFFDIASAFDKVWHDGLIYKLIKLRCPKYIICWLKDFLSNRVFAVRVNESITARILIKAGVPQGAVLSPLLFSLFINDIPINYAKNKNYSLLFADDLCSFHIYKKKRTSVKQIQLYLDRIEKWLKSWRLMMAPHKCNYIVFSNSKSHQEEEDLDIKLLGVNINKSDNPTFLGIRFDKYLSFNNQLDYLKEACMKRVNVLKVLSNRSWGLKLKTLNQIYNSLIRSLLEYSSIIYPCFSTTNLAILERIQFKCLKIINRKSKFSSNSEIKEMSDYFSIQERFDELNLKYIKRNLKNNNEIIKNLLVEYTNYSESRVLTKTSLFCKYKDQIHSH